MKKLLLIKHAMPEINRETPASHWHLCEDGCRAAASFAGELETYAPMRMFSSIEPKACETAAIMADVFGTRSQTREGLEEHHRSFAPFLDHDGFIAGVRRCLENPDALVFGSERAAEALARFCSSVDGIVSEVKEGNIAIVAHGTVISFYVSSLTGVDALTVWEQLALPSCVVISKGKEPRALIINPARGANHEGRGDTAEHDSRDGQLGGKVCT